MASSTTELLQRNKAFLLLRYTLIAATAYLILVEGEFSTPPLGVVLAITAALLSNVLASLVPARMASSSGFGLAVIVADTAWITAALVASGRFNAEFFYLYFFVLLLAAIGENLSLIAVGHPHPVPVHRRGLLRLPGRPHAARATGCRGGGERRQREEHLPRHREPRAPHAGHRHHRLGPAAARHAAQRRAAGVRGGGA